MKRMRLLTLLCLLAVIAGPVHAADFAAVTVHDAGGPIYGLAQGEFDPEHSGNEVAYLLGDGSVMQLSPAPSGWAATLLAHGADRILGMFDRPTIALGDVHSAYASNELVVQAGDTAACVYRLPAGGWAREIFFDASGMVGNAWGARVGDLDPLRPGDEVLVIYEGVLDSSIGILYHEDAGVWHDEIIYQAEVGMDSAVGDFDPTHAGPEVVITTEMGPTYELLWPGGANVGQWPKQIMWDDMNNAGWVAEVADVDPATPECEVAYGSRYSNAIMLSRHSGPTRDGLEILFTGIAPPEAQNVWDIAVAQARPASPTLEIAGVDESGSTYLVEQLEGGWQGRILWWSAADPLYAVVAGEFMPAPGEELVVAGESGRVTLLQTVVRGDLNCDGDVDFDDINPFVLGLADPNGYKQRYPLCPLENGDANGDGGLDFDDINPFVALLVGGPHVANYWNSGCLPSRERDVEPCPEPDEIVLTVVGRDLHVLHRNATYNCCPDDIVISLEVQDVLRLKEEEILTAPCYCLCCYDVRATVVGLAPGTYTVEFCWVDYETQQTQCVTQAIVVP